MFITLTWVQGPVSTENPKNLSKLELQRIHVVFVENKVQSLYTSYKKSVLLFEKHVIKKVALKSFLCDRLFIHIY